jgi:N-acyl-L-homoserine lactone synthetase
VEFITGTSGGLSPDLMMGLARFRHQVFIDMLGWQLETRGDGLELDQFDRPDTVYVIARDASGDVTGSARLLPTIKPYLLGEVFPHLLHGQPVPSSPAIWELSRFAAVDFSAAKTSAVSQFSSPVAVGLLRAALRVAADRGAERLITVSPLGIERLLRCAGFRAHRAARPCIVDGHPLFAALIEIDESPRQTH